MIIDKQIIRDWDVYWQDFYELIETSKINKNWNKIFIYIKKFDNQLIKIETRIMKVLSHFEEINLKTF